MTIGFGLIKETIPSKIKIKHNGSVSIPIQDKDIKNELKNLKVKIQNTVDEAYEKNEDISIKIGKSNFKIYRNAKQCIELNKFKTTEW